MPEDLERYVQMKIASGRFPSGDEAIGDALRLLWHKEEVEAQPRDEESKVADSAVPAWRRVLDIMGKVPGEVTDRMPADSSEQLDHYIYGTPKRPIS